MPVFDANLYTLHLANGVEKNSLPGLIALTPPRRPARGRENDSLFGLLTLSGATTITPESLTAWLQKKGEDYYKTVGTVTFAMRTLVELINNELLERNLKKTKDGSQISAVINLAVVKRNNLFILNVGTTHTYFVNAAESLEYTDTDNQGRGLGLNQTVICRFTQKEIVENDSLLFTTVPPASWTPEAFTGLTQLSVDALARRLYNQAGADLKAVLIRFSPGKGLINQAPLPNKNPALAAAEKPTVVEPESTSPALSEQTVIPVPAPELAAPFATDIGANESGNPASSPVSSTPIFTAPLEPVVKTESRKRPEPGLQPPSRPGKQLSSSLPTPAQVKTGEFLRSVSRLFAKIKSSISSFIRKILPGISDEPIKLSRAALIFIAIAVPVLVVAVAGSVYVKKGKSQQFELYMAQAQQYAVQADTQINDEPSRLASLQQALFWVEKAKDYGHSDNADALAKQVQSSLDSMQGVLRLDLDPLVETGLRADVNVTEMVATNADVYLLDGTTGQVLRFFLSGSGYQQDSAFDCGPSPENALNTIGKLVDILPLPVGNSFNATLFGIDAAGNIEFCVPGETGISGTLNPPDQGWMNIKSISLFQNYLHVLDTGGNAVYRFKGTGIQFDEKPTLYFDNQIPSLGEAIDIEANGDELYILRSNGQMVECTYSHMKDYKLTECLDPAPYGDMRTGQTPSTITFPEAQFIKMHMTAAPDSSIYLLDARAKTLFHFSLQRNLQKILHPRLTNGASLAKLTPTAFAVSPGRIAFMAFGDQVFYAPLP
jgi:hypothetical protein